MSSTDSSWLGIDLGGTGTRVALIVTGNADSAGNTDGVDDAAGMPERAGVTVPTSSLGSSPLDGLAAAVADTLAHAGVEMSQVSGLGIGASGPVDLHTGLVVNPDTLPTFTGWDVAGGLSARLGIPSWIDNDAVAAGLAEVRWGGGRGAATVLCVTLGTGVGVVLVQDGRPVRASDGQHPEGGHIPVPGEGSPCYCGLRQCWEQVASRTALDRLVAGGASLDDPELWRRYARGVADGLTALVTLYRPEAVVVGGSVARYWERLEAPLRECLATSREVWPDLRLSASSLGERGGAWGGALLAARRIGWSPTAP